MMDGLWLIISIAILLLLLILVLLRSQRRREKKLAEHYQHIQTQQLKTKPNESFIQHAERRSGQDRRKRVERRKVMRFAEDRRKSAGRRKEDQFWKGKDFPDK